MTVYVTSYLRIYDSDLTMSTTYIVFPLTITTCAIFMQLGAYSMDKIHPKVQMLLGGLCFALPILVCSYVTSFPYFLFFYSIVTGMGFGFIYMLPMRNAWLCYPNHKGMVSGIILSAKSLGSIVSAFLAAAVANPNNMRPTLEVPNGVEYEYMYPPDSEVV